MVTSFPLIMDGAMGTELMDRGLKMPLPLWSADTNITCLLYTSPSPRDQRGSRMPSSA